MRAGADETGRASAIFEGETKILDSPFVFNVYLSFEMIYGLYNVRGDTWSELRRKKEKRKSREILFFFTCCCCCCCLLLEMVLTFFG